MPCRPTSSHTAAHIRRWLWYHQACLPPPISTTLPRYTYAAAAATRELFRRALTRSPPASLYRKHTDSAVNHARRCRLAGAASNQSRLLLLSHARASNMCCSSTLFFKTETSPLLAHLSPIRHAFSSLLRDTQSLSLPRHSLPFRI